MTETEEKNSLLQYLDGKGMVAIDGLGFDDSFVTLYTKHQAALIVDGYLQVYKKPSALIAQMSTYLRITKTGSAFIEKGAIIKLGHKKPAASVLGVRLNKEMAADNDNNRRASSIAEMMHKTGKNYSQIAEHLNSTGFKTALSSRLHK